MTIFSLKILNLDKNFKYTVDNNSYIKDKKLIYYIYTIYKNILKS